MYYYAMSSFLSGRQARLFTFAEAGTRRDAVNRVLSPIQIMYSNTLYIKIDVCLILFPVIFNNIRTIKFQTFFSTWNLYLYFFFLNMFLKWKFFIYEGYKILIAIFLCDSRSGKFALRRLREQKRYSDLSLLSWGLKSKPVFYSIIFENILAERYLHFVLT